ncbi:MAG: DNA gyrase inhibitor YacG [Blastocatellia bacterium]|nr:DNA gyrase inhibitor YacG [Blastocatellia bacterium]
MIRRCPLCRRETEWENNPWRPFCSERCQLIDLGKWATEEYRVPSSAEELPELNYEENSDEQDSDEQV